MKATVVNTSSGPDVVESSPTIENNTEIRAIASAHRDGVLTMFEAGAPTRRMIALRRENLSAMKSTAVTLSPASIFRRILLKSEEEAMDLFRVVGARREEASKTLAAGVSSDDDDDASGEASNDNSENESDGLCDYERLRLRNIKRNNARLAQLGLLSNIAPNAGAGGAGRARKSSSITNLPTSKSTLVIKKPRKAKTEMKPATRRSMPRRRCCAKLEQGFSYADTDNCDIDDDESDDDLTGAMIYNSSRTARAFAEVADFKPSTK